MESYSISNINKALDLKVSLSLSVISNHSGLLIQSNCNRTEYLRGQPCVRLTVEGESNPIKSNPFSCISVTQRKTPH